MKTSIGLLLALVPAATLGCRNARGQDDGDRRRAPEHEVRRPPADVEGERRLHDAAAAVEDCQARLAQLHEVQKLGDQHPEIVKARAELDAARANLERVHADIARHGAEHRRDAVVIHERDDARRREFNRPDAGRGPSVEQRLEQLERAVHEMHEVFERHGVPPERREMAEREMRERRESPPLGSVRPHPEWLREWSGPQRPGDMAGPGAPQPGDGAAPGVPQPARPPSPDAQREMAERMRAEMERVHRDVSDQMSAMRKELDAARAALDDTKAQLEKANAELEKLRAAAPK